MVDTTGDPMGTHSYIDTCNICGGNANVNQGTRPPYTSEECYDCGWWETDQEGYEGSGFMSLNEINDMRNQVGMDDLSKDELEATRIRIKGSMPSTYDEYASVINRKQASRDL